MTITGINYKLIYISVDSTHTFDHIMEAEIPFEGDDISVTQINRETVYTKFTKYSQTQEIIDQFKALIDKYGITDWVGKTPALPKKIECDGRGELNYLTLRFADGTSSTITFREVPEETGKAASSEFSKLFYECINNEKKISEEETYPTLNQCRELKEEHGPVVAIETSSFESGMMYNSNIWYIQTIEKVPDKEGIVKVTLKRKQGDLPEQTDSKEVESDIFSKVQEISDRENLPVWNYAAIDPNLPREIVFDYTFSSSINIYYDDTLVTGASGIKRSIGEAACKMGGSEVDKQLSALIKECVSKSGAKIEVSTANPYLYTAADLGGAPQQMPLNAFMGIGQMNQLQQQQMDFVKQNIAGQPSQPQNEGTWNCTCGKTGLTGKFCPECGNPRC